MAKIVTYLDECKKKLDISSTYALAKALDIDVRRVQEHYKGIATTNEYLCFKIAQILNSDPAFIIADIKSETEKNEVRKEFFKSIAGSLKKKTAVVILCMNCFLGLIQSDILENARAFFRRFYKFV